MKTKKSIDLLNSLIEIHNDRIVGYETALKESEEAFLQEKDLKKLFSKFIINSQNCKSSLIYEVVNLGGIPVEGTNTASKLFRFWMDLKYALTCNDRYTILKSCVEGEGIAVQSYIGILSENQEILSDEHQTILQNQQQLIKEDQDTITYLFSNSLSNE